MNKTLSELKTNEAIIELTSRTEAPGNITVRDALMWELDSFGMSTLGIEDTAADQGVGHENVETRIDTYLTCLASWDANTGGVTDDEQRKYWESKYGDIADALLD